jgi:hypothetical protein
MGHGVLAATVVLKRAAADVPNDDADHNWCQVCHAHAVHVWLLWPETGH